MPAHEWILWPGLILATGVGSTLVGRRLGPTRRLVLGVASAFMLVPVAYTTEFLASQQSFLWPARLRRYSLYASAALLVLWGLAEILMATDLWEKIVGPLQWGATGVVALLPVGYLLVVMAIQGAEEGSVRWYLGVGLWSSTRVGLLSAPALASVLPLSLAWPGESTHPSVLARQAGTAALLLVVLVPSTFGLLGEDLDLEEQIPSEALQGHEAVITVWVEIRPDPGEQSVNVTVPLPVADGNAPSETSPVVEEIREEIRSDAETQNVSEQDGSRRSLALEVTHPVTLAGDAHLSQRSMDQAVRGLRLAAGNATSGTPDSLEVRVHGSICWEPVHDRAFERVLPVRGAGEEGLVGDPVPFERIPSEGCAFIQGASIR